jgi:hypothetical protein
MESTSFRSRDFPLILPTAPISLVADCVTIYHIAPALSPHLFNGRFTDRYLSMRRVQQKRKAFVALNKL